ncbi:MAG: DOMON-like domain-containing protein [Steroidobacteraceae bacterium]
MPRSDSSFIPLLAHPATPNEAVRRLAARAELVSPDSLRLEYVLEADPRQVRIPPAVADDGRTDRLWAHTCFEAFIGVEDSAQYLELNFSPSTQWAAYRFESYRQGMVPAVLGTAPRLALRRGKKRLELQAEVSLGGTLAAPPREAKALEIRRLRLALSTVVEDREGGLSYWALQHPPGRPDFHHPQSFSLALEFPRTDPT